MKKVHLKNIFKSLASAAALGMALAAPSHAALHDRGGGLLYDDVLNVTWLQDANYAKTSGYDVDGYMNWNQAQTWAQNLVFADSVRNTSYSDWRLPTIDPVNGSTYNGKFSFNGSTDEGHNISSQASELGYMFYTNLGLKSYYDTNGMVRNDYGVRGNGSYGAANVGLVRNLQPVIYWSGSSQVEHPEMNAWMFDPHWGYQNFYSKWDQLSVWAVRDGDVLGSSLTGSGVAITSSVPEPHQWFLLALGLTLMLVFEKNRRSAQQ